MGRRAKKAASAYEANKARILAAGPSGTASEKTLAKRGYSIAPSGEGPVAPKQSGVEGKRRRRRRKK